MTKPRLTAVAVTFALVVAACSGGASPTTPTEPAGGGPTTSVASGSASGIQAPSTSPAAPGTATLTIGDEIWSFEKVVCEFGAAEDSGMAFVLLVEGDSYDLNLTVSITDTAFGRMHSVDLWQNDMPIWTADDRYGENGPTPDDFIVVEGRTVTGDAMFYPSAEQLINSPDAGTPGRFDVNCG